MHVLIPAKVGGNVNNWDIGGEMKRALKWIGGIALFLIVVAVLADKNEDKKANAPTAQQASSSTQRAQPSIPMPPDEQKFIAIVSEAQRATATASNDMQKGGVRAQRATQVCDLLKGSNISGWVGKAMKIDANSDGKGVLSIAIANDIIITTWNNAVSDVSDNTLLEPSSDLFQKASQLRRRQDVRFSGNFLTGSDEDCVKESSLTLDGSLKNPEYLFRFADVTSLQ